MSRKIIGATVGTTINPKRIAEQFNDGTTLPMVTEEDDGKVLKVQDGKWVPQEENNNHEDLDNLPTINGVTVTGNLTGEELNLQDSMLELSTTEIIEIWNKIMNE